MKNVNLILAVLLCVQVVVFLVRPGRTTGQTVQTVQLYPQLEGTSVKTLEISSGEEKVTLVRRDNDWTIVESHGYLADTARIEEILAVLPQLQRAEVISKKTDMFASYDLADTSSHTRLRLLDAESKPLMDLLVGRSLVRSSFVRKFGGDTIFRVNVSLANKLNTRPRDFFGESRIDLPALKDRQMLRVEIDGETLQFRKIPGGEPAPPQKDHTGMEIPIVTPDRWSFVVPEGATENPDAVSSYVSGLDGLYFEDILASEPAATHGFDEPFAKITWTTEKDEFVVLVGNPVDPEKSDGPRAMKVSGKNWVYALDGFSWKRWRKKTDEFLKKDEPATGEVELPSMDYQMPQLKLDMPEMPVISPGSD